VPSLDERIPLFVRGSNALAVLGLQKVMELVEALARRRYRVCRELVSDDRHDALEEAFSLLSRVPYVEDPEHAVGVIEPSSVDDQTVDGLVAEAFLDEVVIRGRAVRDRDS
jgi:hypothetical protein